MVAHIIFMNDAPQWVVIDELLLAKRLMRTMREGYWGVNRGKFPDKKAYEETCRWHIDTVPASRAVWPGSE
jgi:hypothetical protein